MDINIKAPEEKPEDKQKAAQPTILTLKLLKNWTPRPDEDVTVLGWNKPAVIVKLATGGSHTAEPARFVEGEMAPPPVPGAMNVSSSMVPKKDGKPGEKVEEVYTKIWAGTFVEVPTSIAKRLIDTKAAELYLA